MEIVRLFITEVRNFSKTNWWVYVIYVALMIIIPYSGQTKMGAVFLKTSLHFVADIFIMMMIVAYSKQEFVKGTYFQAVAYFLFLGLKLYTGLVDDRWQYIVADPIYLLAAIKNYSLDVRKKDIPWINYKSMSLISIFLVVGVILPLKQYGAVIFTHPQQVVLAAGIFLFAIALSITNREKFRFEVSLLALAAMVVGSGWGVFKDIRENVEGLDLSYFLLPLVVLVHYFRNWNLIMHPKVLMGNKTLGTGAG